MCQLKSGEELDDWWHAIETLQRQVRQIIHFTLLDETFLRFSRSERIDETDLTLRQKPDCGRNVKFSFSHGSLIDRKSSTCVSINIALRYQYFVSLFILSLPCPSMSTITKKLLGYCFPLIITRGYRRVFLICIRSRCGESKTRNSLRWKPHINWADYHVEHHRIIVCLLIIHHHELAARFELQLD